MRYNKLVRDTIIPLLQEKKLNPVFHVASEKEFETKLKEKLQEEVTEFFESQSVEELADITEVICAWYELKGIQQEDIEKVRLQKKNERGGFTMRYILEETND